MYLGSSDSSPIPADTFKDFNTFIMFRLLKPPVVRSVAVGAIRRNGTMAGKIVVISGASGGIGEELGLLYAKKGAKLVLAARSEDKLKTVREECLKAGAAQTEIMRCDVSNENDCKDLINLAVNKYGSIDVLILNAGIGQVIHG